MMAFLLYSWLARQPKPAFVQGAADAYFQRRHRLHCCPQDDFGISRIVGHTR